MIRLYDVHFTKEEYQLLHDFIEQANIALSAECISNCKDCDYRHICADLAALVKYTAERVHKSRIKGGSDVHK